jgi:dihydroorotase-like cyclic amidohydrolase
MHEGAGRAGSASRASRRRPRSRWWPATSQLARLTGAPVHFLHLSTAGSVELVRLAKAEGLPVTAEAAPHHMLLTHAEVAGYDPVFKVNPPLRTDATWPR